MSSAKDEFDALVQKERVSSHPEDRDHHSDHTDSEPEDDTHNQYVHSDDEDDDDDHHHDHHNNDAMVSRSTAYHIPNTVYDANTGPKGVIADAQAFERARKRSFRRTLLSVTGFDQFHSSSKPTPIPETDTTPLNRGRDGGSPHSSAEEDEESFLRKWRESRMQELQKTNTRHLSPRRRMFGSVEIVDAAGYLDAVERSPSGVTVVVCIYDPDSNTSGIVEDSLHTVARKNPATRFIKLHHEIAEMENIEAPALLAYRGGDVTATLVDIPRQIPRGRPCSAESLEDLLKLHRVL
ncbi:hypothetical protein ASPZODRAFT_148346 [Penicilliopsis zonata CBS 506.65]|uniref:Phosducin domain-containing protein n=1 Tax=Penicilliopsis zonata CBS 506.65 TaxID=1073090 RepID=A0A1L9SV15_9EURO|nr:hypothetical protein ASPZODRAFT_148346 [Penicilliopsis zonata CBS 506.65]OJJ50961.1 hypothetical protein ASPZODRAFT_148346 [Penicilliopsis zonata CBS 506.65]